ncbi:Hypothetical predicted protein [Drosophila guanche]|nr:Hypothetical predicted protein [Drosophila guanche]
MCLSSGNASVLHRLSSEYLLWIFMPERNQTPTDYTIFGLLAAVLVCAAVCLIAARSLVRKSARESVQNPNPKPIPSIPDYDYEHIHIHSQRQRQSQSHSHTSNCVCGRSERLSPKTKQQKIIQKMTLQPAFAVGSTRESLSR